MTLGALNFDAYRRACRRPFPWRALAAALTIVAWGGAASAAVPPALAPLLAGCEIDYPPFSIVHEDGRADGFSVELMRAALAKMGREVTFRTGPWSEVRGWLERGEVDALPLVGRTPEREALFDFTVPYLTMHGAIVVRRDTTDVRTLLDLRGRRVGVMAGDNAEEFLRREDRDFEIVATPTFTDALHALAEGRCDAVVIQRLVAIRLLRETGLDRLRIIDRPIHDFAQTFCFAVKAGDRATLALLNEGLALAVADGTQRRLHAKWFAALELPSDRPIVIGGDHNYPPFEFLDENGRPAGYNVDLIRAIADATGLDIRIRLGEWTATMGALERGEIDAILGMLYSSERNETFDFSQAHLVNHCVAVVRKEEGSPPATVADLSGKRIVVQDGDIMHEFCRLNGLTNQLTVVGSQEQALHELAEGKHDCALVARMAAYYWIDRNGWDHLAVGRTPLVSPDYGFAVPKGQRALLAQLREGLTAIAHSGEYKRIQEKWMGVYGDHTNWSNVLKYVALVAGPLLLIALLALLWSWGLRKQVAARTRELRESTQELARQFRLLRVAGKTTRFGGWSVDLATNTCTWSDIVATIHGMPRGFSPKVEEAIAFYAPEWRDKIQELFAACAEKGIPYDEEMEILARSGERVWVRAAGEAIRDPDGRIVQVQGSFQDIGKQKATTEALLHSEEILNQTGEMARVGGWKVDLETDTVIWTRTTRIIHEVPDDYEPTLEEAVNFFPEAREELTEAIRRAREEGTPYDLEIPFVSARGRKLWIRTIGRAEFRDGTCVRLHGAVQDITDRRLAADELRRSNNLLERIFEVLPIGLWLTDREGTLLRGNPAGVSIWGAEPTVPISEYGVFKAWRLPERTPVEADDWALAKTIREGVTVVDELLEIEAFDGKRKTILNYTTPVLAADGKNEGAIVVNLDVSDRLALEAQLQQAQKMESVGRLAGGVAHDFNNLLMGIMGYADLCRADLPENHPVREWIDEITREAERSATLTRQLLAFARKQTVAPKVVDLNDIVGNMLKMLRRLIGEDIDLSWQPGAALWSVKLDPGQLDQILVNLCVNARDAIDGAGTITIETENVSIDTDYCAEHAEAAPGAYVMIAVSDDGCGMDRETVANIFEPFFTTKGIGKGTGLGLATVYGIVKQNEGCINAYSELGEGSTFRIYLPRVEEAKVETADVATKTVLEGGTETILLVEDEKSIRVTMYMFLEQRGYTVLPANGPEAALSLAAAHTGEIDLLITDVVMPGMSGRELAEKLAADRPSMKVLYMSGYTANVIAHRGILEAGVQFLSKPVGRDTLARKVREVLEA